MTDEQKANKAQYDKDRRDRLKKAKEQGGVQGQVDESARQQVERAEVRAAGRTPEAQAVEPPPDVQVGPAVPVPGATIQRVMENSVIFILKFSRLQTKRSMGTDAIEVDSDKSMIHVAKDILDSEELRAITSYDNTTAMWFRNRCTYAPWVRGFLMSSQLLADAFAWLDLRQAGRDELIAKFKKAYPALRADAKTRLKGNYDATEYPSIEKIERAFTMEYMPIDFAVSKKLTSVISKAAFDRESQKLQSSMASAAQTLDQTLAFILQETVGQIIDTLTDADTEGKPKRVHPARLAKLEEFIAIFPKRNLTGNEELAELVDKARKVTAGVDVKQLKNVADTRVAVLTELTSVKASVNKMLVDAPRRRMSLKDEEV